MSVRLVWPFVQLAAAHEQAGLRLHLQAQLGLDEQELHDPDVRIPTQFAIAQLERAIYKLYEPNLGLRAAQHVTAEHLGITEYLARTHATLGEALRSCDRYVRLLADGVHQSLDVRAELAYARLWFDSNLVASAAAYEFALAVQLQLARRITGQSGLAPLHVHFTHMQPRDLRLHRETFKCALHFNMPVTQMVFAADILTLPLLSAEPALNRLLERHAEAMLAQLPCTENLVERVRDILGAETELGNTSATRLALRLGMSVRSLARRLCEEGTSYRELLDERRKRAAMRDLAQTLRPIHDISQQLGFATSQSFHRAFRRWTGETAAGFRDRSRQRDSASA